MTIAQNLDTGKFECVEDFFDEAYEGKLDEIAEMEDEYGYFSGVMQHHVNEAYDYAVRITNHSFGTNGKNLDEIIFDLKLEM